MLMRMPVGIKHTLHTLHACMQQLVQSRVSAPHADVSPMHGACTLTLHQLLARCGLAGLIYAEVPVHVHAPWHTPSAITPLCCLLYTQLHTVHDASVLPYSLHACTCKKILLQ